MESFTGEEQGGYLVPNSTGAGMSLCASYDAVERKLKSSSCDRPIHIFSSCLWLPTQKMKEVKVLCPLKGGKPGEAGEDISDCTGGWLQALIAQPHGQTGQCLSCVSLKRSFPVSLQHWKLSMSEEARPQDLLQQSCGNAAASWHSLDIFQLL